MLFNSNSITFETIPKPFDFRTFLGPSEKIRTSGLLNPMVPVKSEIRKLVHENVKTLRNSITFSALFYVQYIVFFYIPVKIPVRKITLKTAFGSTQNLTGTTFKRPFQRVPNFGLIDRFKRRLERPERSEKEKKQ